MKKGKRYVLVITLVMMVWLMIPTGASAGSTDDIRETMETINNKLNNAEWNKKVQATPEQEINCDNIPF